MATQKNNQTKMGIPTGYEGANIPENFSIPPVGLYDVDKAMFDLFDKDNPIYVESRDANGIDMYQKKVPVVLATGERFALKKRQANILNKNGSLILPIISIKRTRVDQAKENMGSAIGQDTGDLVIKKKISSTDSQYQNIINKLNLKNQNNVSSNANFINQSLQTGSIDNRFASRRDSIGTYSDEALKPNINTNIFEILTIPFPIRYTVSYKITIWTSYQVHMNVILEKIMTNYDGQGKTYKLKTDKGYYFVAYFDDGIETEDNMDEFTNEQKINKYVFNVNVPAYMIANKNGGDSIPIRKFYSAPQISFDIYDGIYEKGTIKTTPVGDVSKFILSNINNLNEFGDVIENENDYFERQIIKNPFSGKQEDTFVRVKYRNARAGETVISNKVLLKIDIP